MSKANSTQIEHYGTRFKSDPWNKSGAVKNVTNNKDQALYKLFELNKRK